MRWTKWMNYFYRYGKLLYNKDLPWMRPSPTYFLPWLAKIVWSRIASNFWHVSLLYQKLLWYIDCNNKWVVHEVSKAFWTSEMYTIVNYVLLKGRYIDWDFEWSYWTILLRHDRCRPRIESKTCLSIYKDLLIIKKWNDFLKLPHE